MLKTDVDEQDLRVESWVSVYPGADWHERETWEMFGIGFDGHPALRHLYLPSEFEGHPLRKDFPLLAREVKPWPGLVDVEPMPGEDGDDEDARRRWRRRDDRYRASPPPGTSCPRSRSIPRCSASSRSRRSTSSSTPAT